MPFMCQLMKVMCRPGGIGRISHMRSRKASPIRSLMKRVCCWCRDWAAASRVVSSSASRLQKNMVRWFWNSGPRVPFLRTWIGTQHISDSGFRPRCANTRWCARMAQARWKGMLISGPDTAALRRAASAVWASLSVITWKCARPADSFAEPSASNGCFITVSKNAGITLAVFQRSPQPRGSLRSARSKAGTGSPGPPSSRFSSTRKHSAPMPSMIRWLQENTKTKLPSAFSTRSKRTLVQLSSSWGSGALTMSSSCVCRSANRVAPCACSRPAEA